MGTRNRVYKEMRTLSPQDPESCEIPNQKAKEKTSQYKGVCWKKETKKWMVMLTSNGKFQKYGGCFDDELDAAKSVNQLCKQLGIPEKNPRINGIPNQQWKAKGKTSQYKGIFLHKQTGKWNVGFRLNENKIYGGSFIDELDAAMKVNQLCEELGIPERNPGIGTMPLRPCQAKEKTSKYKGVSWSNKQKKWYVRLIANDRKQKYGGSFSDELDAAKKVNQLCAELEIPEKNPGIGTMLHQQWQAREKTSKYKGVSWNKTCGKWYVRLRAADGKLKYGGGFNNELDAAKRVNQLCEKLGIPEKNLGIEKIPHQKRQHSHNKNIGFEYANSVTGTEITKTDDCHAIKEKKRKREKNKFPFEQYYFHDNMLK